MLSHERVIQWMNVIRKTTGASQYRILENFWASQLNSKVWMVRNILKNLNIGAGKIYIMGGWYGLSAQLLVDHIPNTIAVSIDADPQSKLYGTLLASNTPSRDIPAGTLFSLDDFSDRYGGESIKFIIGDMETYDKYDDAVLIVNTSVEHVEQHVFDSWIKNVPENVPVVLQGNNFFTCNDHIRCSTDIDEFKKMNPLGTIIFSDKLDCNDFYRFMTIGYR